MTRPALQRGASPRIPNDVVRWTVATVGVAVLVTAAVVVIVGAPL